MKKKTVFFSWAPVNTYMYIVHVCTFAHEHIHCMYALAYMYIVHLNFCSTLCIGTQKQSRWWKPSTRCQRTSWSLHCQSQGFQLVLVCMSCIYCTCTRILDYCNMYTCWRFDLNRFLKFLSCTVTNQPTQHFKIPTYSYNLSFNVRDVCLLRI